MEDLEALRMILDTVGAAGEGAADLALLWILRLYFTDVLVAICACGFLWIIWSVARAFVAENRASESLNRVLKVVQNPKDWDAVSKYASAEDRANHILEKIKEMRGHDDE